jgi:hypothetical protein
MCAPSTLQKGKSHEATSRKYPIVQESPNATNVDFAPRSRSLGLPKHYGIPTSIPPPIYEQELTMPSRTSSKRPKSPTPLGLSPAPHHGQCDVRQARTGTPKYVGPAVVPLQATALSLERPEYYTQTRPDTSASRAQSLSIPGAKEKIEAKIRVPIVGHKDADFSKFGRSDIPPSISPRLNTRLLNEAQQHVKPMSQMHLLNTQQHNSPQQQVLMHGQQDMKCLPISKEAQVLFLKVCLEILPSKTP